LIAGSISFLRRSKHKASTGIDLAGYIDFWEEQTTKHLLELILQVPRRFGKNKQKASTGIDVAGSFAFWKNEHKA
jgi:hypothetical protein